MIVYSSWLVKICQQSEILKDNPTIPTEFWMTGWVHLSYGLHPPTTKHTKRNKTSWLFFRSSVLSKLVSSHQWWQAAATCSWCYWHLSAVGLLFCSTCTVSRKSFCESAKLTVALTYQSVGQLDVWCWSEIFSSVASTAAWYSSYIVDQIKSAFEWSICSLSKLLWWKINLMLFACPKFGPYGNLFIQMANCMQVGRTVGM